MNLIKAKYINKNEAFRFYAVIRKLKDFINSPDVDMSGIKRHDFLEKFVKQFNDFGIIDKKLDINNYETRQASYGMSIYAQCKDRSHSFILDFANTVQYNVDRFKTLSRLYFRIDDLIIDISGATDFVQFNVSDTVGKTEMVYSRTKQRLSKIQEYETYEFSWGHSTTTHTSIRLHNLRGPATIFYGSGGKIQHMNYVVNGSDITRMFDKSLAANEVKVDFVLKFGSLSEPIEKFIENVYKDK